MFKIFNTFLFYLRKILFKLLRMTSLAPKLRNLLIERTTSFDKDFFGIIDLKNKYSEYGYLGNYPSQNEKIHFDNDPHHEVEIRNIKYNQADFLKVINGKTSLRTHLIKLHVLHTKAKEKFINYFYTIYMEAEFEGKYKIESPTFDFTEFELYYDTFMLIKDDKIKKTYIYYWQTLTGGLLNELNDVSSYLHSLFPAKSRAILTDKLQQLRKDLWNI